MYANNVIKNINRINRNDRDISVPVNNHRYYVG